MKKVAGISLLVLTLTFGVPSTSSAQDWPAPTISSINYSSAVEGTTVTIYGTNFDSSVYVEVIEKNLSIYPTSYSANHLTFVVPAPSTLNPGTYTLRVSQVAGEQGANTIPFTVVAKSQPPVISEVIPSTAKFGDKVTIYGSHFDSSVYIEVPGKMSIFPTSYNTDHITFIVPTSIGLGTHVIRVSQAAGETGANTSLLTVVQTVVTNTSPVPAVPTPPIPTFLPTTQPVPKVNTDAQREEMIVLLQKQLMVLIQKLIILLQQQQSAR